MIEFKDVSFTYESGETENNLSHINLTIQDGETILFCGESGCGKTTLTRLINGLIPHYYGGKLTGQVLLDGKELKDYPLYQIGQRVGSVFQNPGTQFYNVDTTSEIVFGCENMALPVPEMRKRLEETVHSLKLEKLLNRSLFALSGGEKQKIACASADAIHPDIFVLDEPSSNLDIATIEDLIGVIRHWQSEKKTVIVAEHRLYYLRGLADRFIYLAEGQVSRDYSAAEFEQLTEQQRSNMGLRTFALERLLPPVLPQQEKTALALHNFRFAYKNEPETLHIMDCEIPTNRIVGIIGNNGAGKSTFSRCFCGLEKRCGEIVWNGRKYRPKDRLSTCYMVMQDVNHQLFTESVLEEVLLSMPGKDSDESPENVAKAEAILTEMDLLPYKACHPMGLSGGQKQRVAIASAIASERPVILFDEPTSGLDLFHMRQVADSVKELADSGKTIVIVTHDPEFILRCCNYVIHLENGRLEESYFLQDTEGRERLFNFFMMEGGGGNQTV